MESLFSHFGPARYFVVGLLAGSIFSLRSVCVIVVLTVLFSGMKTDNVTCRQIQSQLSQWVPLPAPTTQPTYWSTGWNYLAFLSGTPVVSSSRWPYEDIFWSVVGLLLGNQMPVWLVLFLLSSSYVWLDRSFLGSTWTCRQHLVQSLTLLRDKVSG